MAWNPSGANSGTTLERISNKALHVHRAQLETDKAIQLAHGAANIAAEPVLRVTAAAEQFKAAPIASKTVKNSHRHPLSVPLALAALVGLLLFDHCASALTIGASTLAFICAICA